MRHSYEQALELNKDPTVAERLKKIGASLEYVERLMYYTKLKSAIKAQPNTQAAEKAIKARAFLEKLSREVLNDRKKWGGVVSTNVFRPNAYLGRELERSRRTEKALH